MANITVVCGREKMDIDAVAALLGGTYWASGRARETIELSMENSVCYGAFADEKQIGFARVITDFATTYYICDVVVSPDCRRMGVASALLDAIEARFSGLRGFLATADAQPLYERYGFKAEDGRLMGKGPSKE